ncbi:MAG: Ni-sirohydrochlorin a,c-diamide reductive cyclase catalytic subunit [Thermoplasmata archaeon]|nr:Ni-sirohydrochlorin a,c-diamide reductive cyclase catalytic subunit [Thermoplasmata archaeon]
MRSVIHPRPSPIVAAMYTLRDMDIDVIVVHGPSGCSFMASRPLENADVRVVTTGMRDNDLIFGASEPLINTLKQVEERFHPETVAVIGTCASMIIGEDMASAIRKANIDANVFPVDVHACMGDNTRGAIKALEAGRDAGIIDAEECARQVSLMKAATRLEKDSGMASKDYIKPATSPTKLHVCRRIEEVLSNGGKVAVVMDAKKELAFRFADMFEAVDRARKKLGGETLFVANLDSTKGLPRIRNYCTEILTDLESKGVKIDEIVGGLDEYSIVGQQMKEKVDAFGPDLTIILGICHAYPGMGEEDILITDQPRQLANYLNAGCQWAVGEISSHPLVMGAHAIVPLETADTLRELL